MGIGGYNADGTSLFNLSGKLWWSSDRGVSILKPLAPKDAKLCVDRDGWIQQLEIKGKLSKGYRADFYYSEVASNISTINILMIFICAELVFCLLYSSVKF